MFQKSVGINHLERDASAGKFEHDQLNRVHLVAVKENQDWTV